MELYHESLYRPFKPEEETKVLELLNGSRSKEIKEAYKRIWEIDIDRLLNTKSFKGCYNDMIVIIASKY
jgi:lipid A disaccharide synthetase